MLSRFTRRLREIYSRSRVAFPVAVAIAAVRNRPLEVNAFRPRGPRGVLTPHGRFLPTISGAQEPEDDKPKGEGGDDKKLTQAEVDRIVEQRLARERQKYADYDEVKARAEKADELEAEGKSELEKARGEAVKAKEAAQAAEAKAEEATNKAQATVRRAAIVTEAAKAGATDPDDVHALLSAREFSVTEDDKKLEVTISDDGTVTGAEEVVSAFLKAKPNLVGNTTPPPPGDGGARTPIPPKDLQAQIKEAEDKGDFQTAMSLKNQQLQGLQQPGAQAQT